MSENDQLPYPSLRTDDPLVNRAYRIALGDLMGNIQPFQDGLLEEPQPVMLAGLDYDTPWTRDAAINVWNGVGLIWPEVARHTLLSVLERQEGRLRIGGQYWDAMIWSLGAWAYYLYTGDRDFLALALEAVRNSLERFEAEEYDPDLGLFRGPAVYGDGVAAYPQRYSPGGTSSILDWVNFNPQKKAVRGYGIPMMSLSTNCVYYQSYRVADWMAQELSPGSSPVHEQRAIALRGNIRKHFWNPEQGTFRYLVDAEGGCDHQEGLGHSFALMFDLADEGQARSVLARQVIAPAGIPCVWPTYERYSQKGGYGRHSGTVWPFISAFWGEAALQHGRSDLFEQEFKTFGRHINRHGQCAEIYHPLSGEVYGGLQEAGRGADGLEWDSCTRQSWTASAYLRMLLFGVAGLRFSSAGVSFQPCLPEGLGQVQLSALPYRGGMLTLNLKGRGTRIRAFSVNGLSTEPFLPAPLQGEQRIEIELEQANRS
jgi:glycogen debranching enzyme